MLAQLGLLALSALPSAVAWGTIGSEATALVAEHFMTPATVKAVKQMLGDSSSTYLQTAATYGASYSTSKAGSWSYNDFYMWPEDEPNTYCNISFTDCTTTGCSTLSFGNWTAILTDTPTPSTTSQKKQALQLLISLFPSMSTPLNNDATNGTSIHVKFNGAATTVYNAWESSIPAALGANNASLLASYILSNFTKTAPVSAAKAQWAYPTVNTTAWLYDLSTCWSGTTSNLWQHEANALVCSAVYPASLKLSPKAIAGTDLGTGKYYAQAAPVVQMQLARAGYRLAAYLNLIFAGQPALLVPVTADVPMCNTSSLTMGGTAFKTT